MPDFYDELETNRGDFIEEEFFFAPTMDEICQFVDLDMLERFSLCLIFWEFEHVFLFLRTIKGFFS